MNSRDASTPLLTDEQLKTQLESQTAPKVTPEQLEALIVKEQYTLHEGTTLITCVLTLKNGFIVSGESACADKANFNETIGRTIARRNAKDKIWSLEGYVLRNKLALLEAAPAPTMSDSDVKTYVGTKVVHACPMSLGAYNKLRGWELPADEDGDTPGYLIEYTDGGKPNLAGFKGYVSWSPRDVFEKAYDVGVIIKKTTHVERMVKELEELTVKVDALNKFTEGSVFPTLDILDREDLYEQLYAMVVYQRVLARRLQRAQDKS